MEREFFEIESVIGYHFKDREILLTALTHPSYANEHNMRSYDRLEFVGDSILDFVVADELFRRYKDKDEGVLTKMRANIVSRDPLASIVNTYHFVDYMLITGTENRQFGTKELSNVFEALVGAIYYDSGIEKARDFIMKFLGKLIESPYALKKDYKSELQEYAQDKHLAKIEYRLINHECANNKHTYTMEVRIGDLKTVGKGSNRQAGEKDAAHNLLQMLMK